MGGTPRGPPGCRARLCRLHTAPFQGAPVLLPPLCTCSLPGRRGCHVAPRSSGPIVLPHGPWVSFLSCGTASEMVNNIALVRATDPTDGSGMGSQKARQRQTLPSRLCSWAPPFLPCHVGVLGWASPVGGGLWVPSVLIAADLLPPRKPPFSFVYLFQVLGDHWSSGEGRGGVGLAGWG